MLLTLFAFQIVLTPKRKHHTESTVFVLYLQKFPRTAVISPDDLARGRIVSPLVAVFVYSVSGKAWCSPDALDNPGRTGYLRSLARRMFREATQAVEGSEPCVA